jgi:hypothetical protein
MDDFDTQAPDIVDVPAVSAPEASPSATLSDALDNAFDNVFSDEPEMQSGRARDQSGRFAKGEAKGEVTAKPSEVSAKSGEVAAKSSEVAPTAIEQAINPDEPPARLSAEAKAQWGALPPAVKADVHRTIREMQGGIEKYRTEATRWQTDVAPYETLAQQYGMDIKGVLADYEGMARMMATNPVQVFDTLAKRHGFTLQDVAANVLGQDLDDYAKQTSQEIARLQQENMELKRQTQTYTQRQQQEVQSFITDFAVKNPRYGELEPQIAGILRSGLVTATEPRMRLQEAYEIADRLKPAPRTAPAPQTPAIADQTRKGQLSITGAPGSGSNPANRKTPASAREALDRAFDQYGL